MTSYTPHFLTCKLLTGINNLNSQTGQFGRISFHAVFLPFIGIAMMLTLFGRKLISVIFGVTVKSTGFGWSPTEAYLDGKQCSKKGQSRPEGTRRCDEAQHVKRQKIQLSEL